MQSPGAPDEDDSQGFKYGGWAAPYRDGSLGDIIDKEISEPFDLLLGAKTYSDIFAPYWPKQSGTIADAFNKATKYVVSDKPIDLSWKESVLIDGDVVAKIQALKKEGVRCCKYGAVATLSRRCLKTILSMSCG